MVSWMDNRVKRRTQTQHRQMQDNYTSIVFILTVFLSVMKVESVTSWNLFCRRLVFTDSVLLVRCFFPEIVSSQLWLFSWLPMFFLHVCLIISTQHSPQLLSDCQSLKLVSGVKSSYLDVSITSVLFCPCFSHVPLMFSMCLPVLSASVLKLSCEIECFAVLYSCV